MAKGIKKIQHFLFSKKPSAPAPSYMDFINYDYEDPSHFKGMPYEKWRTGALERELKDVQKSLKKSLKQKESAILKQQEIALIQLLAARKVSLAEMQSYRLIDDAEEFNREIELAMLFQGPGIVEVHSILDLESGEKVMIQKAAGYKFEVKGEQGELIENKAIDLKKLAKLQQQGKLSDEQKQLLMTALDDAFEGMERLHAMGFIHRDFKPQNILVTKEGRGRLADFGTVCKKEGDLVKSRYFGTPGYSAPELCGYSDNDRWKNIDEKSDVWSAGMVLMDCCFEDISSQDHPAIRGMIPHDIKESLRGMVNKPKYKAIYESLFVEPENKNSFDYLVWWATRAAPEERPTMAEFRKKYNEIRAMKALPSIQIA